MTNSNNHVNIMPGFSIILAVNTSNSNIDHIFKLLRKLSAMKQKLEIIVVDMANVERSIKNKKDNQSRYNRRFRYKHCPGASIGDAFKAGIAIAAMEWVLLLDHVGTIPKQFFEKCERHLKKKPLLDLLLVYSDINGNTAPTSEKSYQEEVHGNEFITAEQLDMELQKSIAGLFRRELLMVMDFEFLSYVRSGLQIIAITALYLLRNRDSNIGILNVSNKILNNLVSWWEPNRAFWEDPGTYDAALKHGYLALLQRGCSEDGKVPLWLQKTVLLDLQYYFKTDMGERSPTVVVTEPMANVFHKFINEIMRYINVEAIEFLSSRSVYVEVIHALFSYKALICYSPVAIDSYDHQQGLIRLSYYCHGTKPLEDFLLDGHAVAPVYSKYRACNFFRRKLLQERIVWLSAGQAKKLIVQLDGKAASIMPGKKRFISNSGLSSNNSFILLSTIRSTHPPGRAELKSFPSGFRGIKIRLVRWLARTVLVRSIFKDAWVFSDREDEADDNAEHFYRWIRKYHPEINAWFLLSRSSDDWGRLKEEGFRLISTIWLRKLLILNSRYNISSQLDYVSEGLSTDFYGDLMRFLFVFLGHGINQNDQSHWYNNNEIDLIVAATPAEYSAFSANDTPYYFTRKNTILSGLPRFDSLLAKAAQTKVEEINYVLIMPTWRGSLVDDRSKLKPSHEIHGALCESDYIKSWRRLLSSEELQSVATRHSLKIVFMPHPSALSYLDEFKIPEHVKVFTKKNISIQQLFCRTAVMITDYSSVAFEMGFLHRPVIYYQFDWDQFYGGAHNWREGYFKYDRDGFGPVVKTQNELISELEKYLINNRQPSDTFLKRMETAFPNRDGQACRRLYNKLCSLQINNMKSRL